MKRINQDYHEKTQSLDEHYGCEENNGFKARLNSFGQDYRVLGPAISAFGEMPSDVEHIAETIATCFDRLFSKNGRMPGGAGRRTSTSFEAINASSATGIPNLVR